MALRVDSDLLAYIAESEVGRKSQRMKYSVAKHELSMLMFLKDNQETKDGTSPHGGRDTVASSGRP